MKKKWHSWKPRKHFLYLLLKIKVTPDPNSKKTQNPAGVDSGSVATTGKLHVTQQDSPQVAAKERWRQQRMASSARLLTESSYDDVSCNSS